MSSANFKLKRTAAASRGFLATARFSCNWYQEPLFSGSIKFMRIFEGVLWKGRVKGLWVIQFYWDSCPAWFVYKRLSTNCIGLTSRWSDMTYLLSRQAGRAALADVKLLDWLVGSTSLAAMMSSDVFSLSAQLGATTPASRQSRTGRQLTNRKVIMSHEVQLYIKPGAMRLRTRGHDFMLPFAKQIFIRRISLSEPCKIIFRMCSGLSYSVWQCVLNAWMF